MPPELHVFAGMQGFDLQSVINAQITMAVREVHCKSLNLLVDLRVKKNSFKKKNLCKNNKRQFGGFSCFGRTHLHQQS